jgi:hypothetical protein
MAGMLTMPQTPDFGLFLDQIESEKLRAVALAWEQARQGQVMPSFRRLRPAAIAAQLPIIWIYAYDRGTCRFTGRLAGERIAQAFNKNFRGIALEDVHPPHLLDWVHGAMSRVVLEPSCYRNRGALFRKTGQTGIGERIMLPLADDGANGDGVLGASDYELPGVSAIEGPIELISEDESWFGLG